MDGRPEGWGDETAFGCAEGRKKETRRADSTDLHSADMRAAQKDVPKTFSTELTTVGRHVG
jgi:hypothetical protein